MSESYLELSKSDQAEILQTAAATLGKQAVVLEKDVWVCWALQALFSMPDAHPMAFKGGTSLSKIYSIIDRFSEDVDITLDYREFADELDPLASIVSKTAIKKFSQRLKGYVREYSNDVVAPHIKLQLELMSDSSPYRIEVSEDGEKIWIHYPSAIENNDEYLSSSILIELGGRNVIDPNERHIVTPDISELTSDLDFPTAEIVVLSAERTFWEKATLIHVECQRDEFKENADRLSRHWYDLSMFSQHAVGKSAIKNRELMEDVVRHKQIFFNASYANYDACLTNNFRLLPGDTEIHKLQSDYKKMLKTGMMYGKPPDFSIILAEVQHLENLINDRTPNLAQSATL